ncbi:unnamed protein product [Ranitomeya imitator]|uniref:alpha-L-fucosidase n=1 Tax=Ranitomeya imitator TaxID=111125 RepID=A0ABN9LL84_9NEOB|nr:unnamed protein product [Ranitomeya imitator]
MDVGSKRDLVGELADAIRRNTDLHFGLYHSLFEWFNPLFLTDKQNAFQTPSKSLPELYEIVLKYKPEIVWSDGDVKDVVVTNDRWGTGCMCKHGGFYTCSDRYNPGHLLPHKWENCMTIDKRSWGYRRNALISELLTIEELVKELVETVSCGGNLLMNIGPTHDGRIPVVFEERLKQMGKWLKVNGEAIYSTKPWRAQNDSITPGVWYTCRSQEQSVYAIFLEWPTNWKIILGEPIPGGKTENWLELRSDAMSRLESP